MRSLAAVALLGMMALALIVFVPMEHSHGMMGEEMPCPIASLLQTVCPDGISMASFYGAVNELSAVVSTSLVLLAVLLCACVCAFGFALVPVTQRRVRRAPDRAVRTRKEYSWLARFENSPSFV